MARTTIPAELVAINAIQGTLIADNAITAVHIATNAVSGTLVADNAITSTHIAQNNVTATQIAQNTITVTQMADSAIETAKINNDAVTQAKIADDAVGPDQLAANAVVSASIANGTIVEADMADNAVTLAKMASLARGSIIYGDSAGDPAALSIGSNGTVLSSDGTDVSWAAASGTTINNNADNRIITGSGTANTLNGESALTFDGNNNLKVLAAGNTTTGGNIQLGITTDDAAKYTAITAQQHNSGTETEGFTLIGGNSAAADTNLVNIGGGFGEQNPATQIQFYTGSAATREGTLRMVIDPSGDVGIGITNPAHTLSVYKAGDGQTPVRFNTGNNEPLDFYNDSETWKIQAAQGIGFMAKGTGLITFYTTDSETECARWTNNRAFKTKQGTSAYANATSNYNEICSNTGATANLLIRQGSTYYADCVNLWYYGGTPNNTQSNFLNAFDSTATRAKIFSNGGFANYQSNDSNLCDEREKKNIVASNSTWNDVKSWNIKTFHYNEDDDSDAKRYGVIAQDIEITNPDLVVDWEKQQSREEELWQEEDRPLPEGVSVGDVKEPAQAQVMRKAVKEQQMYIMSIKALQEAMTEIEDLKSRIETLEG